MTTILAIDCSDRACSVALGNANAPVLEYTDEPRQHAKKLLPMYRQLISDTDYESKDIEAVAIAAGPGSFTGLRIGFSFAQGIAFALNKPLVLVSSLEAMALSSLSSLEADADKGKASVDQIHVCLDARMGELYVAGFNVVGGEDASAVSLSRQYEDALIGLESYDLSADYSQAALVGSGFALETLAGLKAASIDTSACICALAVHRLGLAQLSRSEGVYKATEAEPAYLRRENAWKTLEQQKALKSGIQGRHETESGS